MPEKLTNEQIDAMPAGREMDALVAQLVIGWVCGKYYQDLSGGILAVCSKERGYLRYGAHQWARMQGYQHKEQEFIPCDHFAGYSTDIAAAWMVVDKMREHGWSITVARFKGGPYSQPDISEDWKAVFESHLEPFTSVGWGGDSAPLAICRAALRATNA